MTALADILVVALLIPLALPVCSILCAWVAILVHEFAHAVAAALLGMRVRSIEIGGGAGLFAFWLGSALITLRPWPVHGLVEWGTRSVFLWRSRTIVALLAGPVASLGLTFLAIDSLGDVALHEGDRFNWRGAAHLGVALVMMAVSGWVGLLSLLPIHIRLGRRIHPSDGRQVVGLFRQAPPLDEVVAQARAVDRQSRFWRLFLRGDPEAALDFTRRTATGAPHEWPHLVDESIAVFALEGADAGLRIMDEAERRAAQWLAGVAPENPVHSECDLYMKINRAWFLAFEAGRRTLRRPTT